MRQIIVTIGVLTFLSCFGIFIYKVSKKESLMEKGLRYDVEIGKIQMERDSLHAVLKESILREQQYILKAEADSLKADSLTVVIISRERKIKTYEERLREVRQITISNPDSFLINRYPESLKHH